MTESETPRHQALVTRRGRRILTVAVLIERLRKLPQDALIQLWDPYPDGEGFLEDAEMPAGKPFLGFPVIELESVAAKEDCILWTRSD